MIDTAQMATGGEIGEISAAVEDAEEVAEVAASDHNASFLPSENC